MWLWWANPASSATWLAAKPPPSSNALARSTRRRTTYSCTGTPSERLNKTLRYEALISATRESPHQREVRVEVVFDVVGDPLQLPFRQAAPVGRRRAVATQKMGKVWHLPALDPSSTRSLVERVQRALGAPASIDILSDAVLVDLGKQDPVVAEIVEMTYQHKSPFILDARRRSGGHDRPVGPRGFRTSLGKARDRRVVVDRVAIPAGCWGVRDRGQAADRDPLSGVGKLGAGGVEEAEPVAVDNRAESTFVDECVVTAAEQDGVG